MDNKIKKRFVIVGVIIVFLIICTYVYTYVRTKNQKDFEEFQNSQRNNVTGTIMTYEEVNDDIMTIANLLMENNISGNLSSGNIHDDFAPECVQYARNDTYYTCYNNGVSYYVIYTDMGWMIVTEEE